MSEEQADAVIGMLIVMGMGFLLGVMAACWA